MYSYILEKIVLIISLISIIFMVGCINNNGAVIVTKYGNTNGNIKEGGFIVKDKDCIYYTNKEDNDCLYKITQYGENTKLTSTYSYELNIIDNNIYYTQGSPGKVRSINVDGKEYKRIFNKEARNLIATDQYLFFLYSPDKESATLYRTNLDGTQEEVWEF